jgi:hypothetical protein
MGRIQTKRQTGLQTGFISGLESMSHQGLSGTCSRQKKREIECAVKENGAAETSYSGSALVIYAAHMFGAPWLLKFLSYLLCLLLGFPSTNNASLCSDPFLKLYHRNCLEVHKDLEQLGRCLVIRRLRQLVSRALENGFVGHTVVLSTDFIHSPYWGKKLLKLLGKQWSTMMNRPFPGLIPLVGFYLLSKLPVYIGRFVGGVKRNDENKRDQEAVYCKAVLEAVRFRKSCGITISCLIADRAFISIDLLSELSGKIKIAKKYILSLKSNSTLKKRIDDVEEWFKDGKGNLVGMVRAVPPRGLFAQGKEITGKKPVRLITDGLPAYHSAWKREFYSNMGPKREHIKDITLRGDIHNQPMERMNGEIRDREKTMRGLKYKDSPIFTGLQVYHNFFREHEGLKGKTPAEASGIQIEGENKWQTFIQNATLGARKSQQPKGNTEENLGAFV